MFPAHSIGTLMFYLRCLALLSYIRHQSHQQLEVIPTFKSSDTWEVNGRSVATYLFLSLPSSNCRRCIEWILETGKFESACPQGFLCNFPSATVMSTHFLLYLCACVSKGKRDPSLWHWFWKLFFQRWNKKGKANTRDLINVETCY